MDDIAWAERDRELAWGDMVRILKKRGIEQDREVYDTIRRAMHTSETVIKLKLIEAVKEVIR